MLEIIAVVLAGIIVGQRGVGRTARDVLGLAKGVTSTALGLAEGVVERLERLTKTATDQAADATERAKAIAELTKLVRENPELAEVLRAAADKEEVKPG